MHVSVVIPTLNEGDRIANLIASTRILAPREIIVVDGGSDDDTIANATAAGADLVLSSQPGRSVQQNLGATRCTGDVVLFLHADCTLTEGGIAAISEGLSDQRYAGGCFRQKIDAPGKRYRAVEWGNNLRARWMGWGYGDQGIFVRRSVFEQLGGFPDVKLMEDLLLVKRLKKHGKFVLLPCSISTSSRRWTRTGVVRQTLTNWCFITLAHCGVSPNWLAKFYPQIR